MSCYTLPAGLLDDRIEFFNDPNDRERCFALVAGKVYPVSEAPSSLLHMVDADMSAHPEKIEALVALGYETQEELREKYCSCCFGAFDGEADLVNGKLIHTEYWQCPLRGTCSAEGILCNALSVGNGRFLTKREVEVLTLAGKCMYAKEIAAALSISEETVKVHLKHIREKSGLDNIQDLVKLAIKKKPRMITISGKHLNGGYVLQTNEAVGGKKQTVTAQTRDAALRVAYFWYRLYIYEKLTAWVHQRIYAIEFSHDPTRLTACSKLLELLENHKQASLDALALMVCRQAENIQFIAPGQKSKHYKIYQHIVLPIITFCKSIAEGQVLTISKSEA